MARSKLGQTYRQPHSLTTCFVSQAILHEEIEYFGKKSCGLGGFSGLQLPQGGGKKVTRCSCVETNVWRPGEIPNPKKFHLLTSSGHKKLLTELVNEGWLILRMNLNFQSGLVRNFIWKFFEWPFDRNWHLYLTLSTWAYILLVEYLKGVQGHYQHLPWEFSLYLRHCQDY